MVYALWGIIASQILLFWLSLIIGLVTVRLVALGVYQRRFNATTARSFAIFFVSSNIISGLIWGIGVVVMFPNTIEYQLLLLFVVVGIGAGSLPTLGMYLPSFFAFFPALIVPVGIRFFLVGEKFQNALGMMAIFYVIALSIMVLNINRSFKESLQLRFNNLDLIEQLRKQKEEAEHTNLAKSKFLAAASHDLRQPLHALTLFTSVLNDSNQTPENRKVVGQIDASVQALESLFNALLDISRLDAGIMQMDKQHFYLQSTLNRLKNDFTPEAQKKGVQLKIPDCQHVVISDPTLLELILRNLVSNAIHYTEYGEVSIRCEPRVDKLLIRIRDTGIGIPVVEQQRIFEEFHQLNNPERDRSKGLGLGLAIVKRTADLLKHDIDVESEYGKGSVFTISVERGNEASARHDATLLTPEPAIMDTPLLFIVIDDEQSVRAGMQERLRLWGYKVITAADQTQALDLIKQSDRIPDGIIADYRLRENRTGIEAIRAIQALHGQDIPALIITGDTAAEQLREVDESGIQILHKPVAPAKLRAFLRSVQRRH